MAASPVELAVGKTATLDAGERERFWAVYRGIRGEGDRPVVINVGGTKHSQPAHWAGSLLSEPADNTEARCTALAMAANILANAYGPADQSVHLDGAVTALVTRGFSKQVAEDTKRNVRLRLQEHPRNVGGKPEGATGGGGASELARLFLTDHYPPPPGKERTGTTSRPAPLRTNCATMASPSTAGGRGCGFWQAPKTFDWR